MVVVRRRSRLLKVTGTVVLVLVAFVPFNELNDVFVRYFDDSIEFRRATDELDKHLGGLYRVDYSLNTGERRARRIRFPIGSESSRRSLRSRP